MSMHIHAHICALMVILAGCAATKPAPITPPPWFIVVDIDGTLTPNPTSVFTARKDAAKALSILAGKGYGILYLSARFDAFEGFTAQWLKAEHFPPGEIRFATSVVDMEHPEIFKAAVLKEFEAKGWRFAEGYGDSTTDAGAYRTAGIAPSRIFGLLREGDQDCQPGPWATCLTGWGTALPLIQAMPTAAEFAAQPISRSAAILAPAPPSATATPASTPPPTAAIAPRQVLYAIGKPTGGVQTPWQAGWVDEVQLPHLICAVAHSAHEWDSGVGQSGVERADQVDGITCVERRP